jgi:hypothetical protein
MFEGTKQPSFTTMILFKVTNYKGVTAHVLAYTFDGAVNLFLTHNSGSPVKSVEQFDTEVI